MGRRGWVVPGHNPGRWGRWGWVAGVSGLACLPHEIPPLGTHLALKNIWWGRRVCWSRAAILALKTLELPFWRLNIGTG